MFTGSPKLDFIHLAGNLQKPAQHSVHWTLGTAASRRAAFSGVFLASSFFYSQTFAYARPLSAANASRWAV
jgi:hypothetical protein